MKKYRLAILGSGSLGRIIGNAISTHLSGIMNSLAFKQKV